MTASPFHLLSHVLFVFSEVMPLRARDWLFSCLYSLQGSRALRQYDNICQGSFSSGRVLSHRTSIQCLHPVWFNPSTPDTAHPSPLGIQPPKLVETSQLRAEEAQLGCGRGHDHRALSCCSLLTSLQDTQICDQLTTETEHGLFLALDSINVTWPMQLSFCLAVKVKHLAPTSACCLWELMYLNSTSSIGLLDFGK